MQPISAFASIWLFVEARKLGDGLAGQGSLAKKYYPQRSEGWRFICPDPKGMVLPAEEVYLCLSKKDQKELGFSSYPSR